MDFVRLNNGVEMPTLGFGAFRINDFQECETAILNALDAGYRLIDTASYYQNEEAIGSALQKTSVPREEIFLTTKIWVSDFGEDKTEQAVYGSLRRLQTDYLDLVLIHQPFGDYYGAYRALEKLYREGVIRAIGISNFYPGRYLDFVTHVDIIPAVNQCETHVFQQQAELRDLMKNYGTHLEAWGPLAQGQNNFFNLAELTAIGDKYGKSNAQVGLRYLIQLGVIAIPKSVNKDRIEQNIDVFDFELSEEDMAEIAKLDQNQFNTYPHYELARVKQILNTNLTAW